MRKPFLLSLLVALLTTLSTHAYEFQSGDFYYNITSDNTVEVTYQEEWSASNYQGLTTATIPETVTNNGTTYSVTSIGDVAFGDCSSLTSITIPNSVTSIGESAFNSCSALTSITIPNSVTSIGDVAFGGCSSLTSITLPNSVTSIGNYAFYRCSSLTSINIPNSVTSIGRSAFYDCSSLTSINIPNSVTSIGRGAFNDCSSLTSITIPDSVTSIGEYAFAGCSSLTSVVWNAKNCAGWSSSSYAPFDDISANITSFTFGEKVETIPSYLCYGMSSLTSITIPNSVSGELVKVDSLNPNAVYFVNMEGWANIHVHAWDDEESGTTWPGEMATLADFTYQGYDVYYFTATPGKYEYCIFNDGGGTQTEDLTWTGGQAYFNNEWHAIKVDPYYKVSIGANAFCSCSFLTDITCLAVNPPTCVINAFNDVPSEATLWCPCESRAEYQSAHGWSQFNRVYPLDFPQATILTDTDRGRAQIDELICTPQSVVISATPYDGYVFTRWSDGNTDNPRTVLLTHDTTLTAEFGLAYSGMCGDNLYWEYKDKVLTIIGNGEMYNAIQWRLLRDSIYSVSLPNSVTNIGDYVFSGCSSLTSLTIPDSVTSIGEYAFAGCSSLTSVVWNAKNCAGWSSSSYAPFYDIRANITSFTFGEEVETIPSYLCYGMSSLTSITIPNSVTSIGDCAFGGCSSLTSVTIPDSVTSIGEYAFAGCSSLTKTNYTGDLASWCAISFSSVESNPTFYSHNLYINDVEVKDLVTFPETVTIIGSYAFSGCTSITSLNIPNSVTSIGESAFYNCSSLTSITIPDSVTNIGEYAFASCSSLTSVVWNAKNCAGWSSSSYAPFYEICANITSFTFGEEVETIPSYLCDGMSSLTSITLPNSVTSIGYWAFSGCSSLTSITIPNSVTSIGDNAFYNCSSLADIYCYATTPPVCDGSTYSGSFRGVSKHCYIHVPAGTIRDYQMADGWRDFYHFYEISELPEGAPTDQVGVTVTGNYATFSWPVNPTASSYTLTITKDGEVFCTLIFNNMGQLVGMAFAPARNGEQSANQGDAQSTAYGFSFVVTNLDANSHYTYTFTVNGADNEVIETYSGAFNTSEETALSETEQQNKPSRKILRDGQVLILRNGVAYDMMGNML